MMLILIVIGAAVAIWLVMVAEGFFNDRER